MNEWEWECDCECSEVDLVTDHRQKKGKSLVLIDFVRYLYSPAALL